MSESNKIEKEQREVEIVAGEAEEDLKQALPALEAAMSALEKLDKGSVSEVKAYTSPPALVQKTMEAVMILFNKTPTWEEAKRVLSDADFLNKIKNFPKESISNKTLKQIEKYTKKSEFTPANVLTIS